MTKKSTGAAAKKGAAKKATKAAPENAAAAVEDKPKREALPEQNGVTMPRVGSKTRDVWDTAHQLWNDNQRPPRLDEVKRACDTKGINEATTTTQYNRWRKFYGVEPQGRAPKAEAPAEAAN